MCFNKKHQWFIEAKHHKFLYAGLFQYLLCYVNILKYCLVFAQVIKKWFWGPLSLLEL